MPTSQQGVYDTPVGSNTSQEIVASYLTVAQGEAGGTEALTSAKDIGQPAGSAIYFAMDFDPGPPGFIPGAQQAIENYFKGVSSAFAGSGYTIGLYGAGRRCSG